MEAVVPTVPTLRFPRAIRELAIGEALAGQHEAGFLDEGPDDPFCDGDRARRGGRGSYVFSGAEARSRRVDLNDPDPGDPIPLPEADAEADATELRFGG